MITVRRTFPEVASYREAHKQCCKCSKNISKRFKQYQTINPWNNKSASDIRSENEFKLDKDIYLWEQTPDKCSACVKSETPDIDITLASDKDWECINDCRDKLLESIVFIRNTEKYLEQELKGKCIMIKDRLAVIDSVSLMYSFPDMQISYTFVRKDLKGLTQETGYMRKNIKGL